MAKKVTVKIKGEETVSKASKTAKASLKDLDKSTSTSSLSMAASLGIVAAALAGVGVALKQAFDVTQYAAQVDQARAAFASMAAESGMASRQVINNIREMSGGTIAELDLLVAASKASLLGLPLDQLDELMKIARASATATGGSVKQMFSDIVTGIGRSSPMILDNLGITIKIGEATGVYAASIGKTAEALTAAEKKQALLNAVLISGEDIMRKVGEVGQTITATEPWQLLTAAVKDLNAELGQELLPTLNKVSTFIATTISLYTEMMRNKREALTALAVDVGDIESIAEAQDMLVGLRAELLNLQEQIAGDLPLQGLGLTEAIKLAAEMQNKIDGITRAMIPLGKAARAAAKALKEMADAEAAAAAAAALRQAQADRLAAAFAKTKEGRVEALRDELHFWEAELPNAMGTAAIQINDVVMMYREMLRVLLDIQDVSIRTKLGTPRFPAIDPGFTPGLRNVPTRRGGRPLEDIPGAAEGGGFDPLLAAAQSLTAAFMQIESLAMVLDPLTTIFETMAAVLEPMINTALAPLVGLLTVMGQMLGNLLLPVIAALAPILQTLVSVVASFLLPAFILLETPIAIVTAALDFLAPIIEVIAKALDQLSRPVEILAVVFGGLMSWMIALGTVIGYIVTFQWGKIKSVAPGVSLSSVVDVIAGIIKRPPLEFGGQLAGVGAGVLEGEPGFEGLGGGGIPSSTTIQRAPDIFLTIHIENIYGAGGAEQAGMDIARVLREHALAGGQIFIQEAIAPMGA